MKIDRRQFLAGVAGVVAGLCVPGGSAQAAPYRAPLSLALSGLKPYYDVVVIGSGYGGAIMAARLASGRSLAVLERGREWAASEFPGSSNQVLSEFRGGAKPLGLFDYRAGANLDVLVGNGLGGTSLINANVVIAPDRDIFGAAWPTALRNDYANGTMAAYEQRVRQVLAVDSIGEATGLRKNWFHVSTTQRRGRAGTGAKATPLSLAVNLSRYNGLNAQGVAQAPCAACGDCVTGCRYGAKNTLDVNYLPLAKQRGAEIFSRIEVERLERTSGGLWRIHFVARPPGLAAYGGSITAKSVVLGAGALGTTQILLRSRTTALPFSDALGKRFSANGDFLGFAYNNDVQTNVSGFGLGTPLPGMQKAGPTITTMADYRNAALPADRYLIEEGAVPSALLDAVRVALPVLAGPTTSIPHDQRMLKDLAGRSSRGALNHSMVYLGIGHDSAGGRLVLDAGGNTVVSWPTIASEPFVARFRAEMARHAQQFGGKFLESPRASAIFGGAMTTVHPLGGCAMGDASANAVVNANGQVFDPRSGSSGVHQGLYAVDGSILPASVGVNPLLTIAALAERAAERFV